MSTEYLKLSTDLAYFALAGTAAITFVGAIDDKAEPQKRQALAIETAVNAIAAFVYKELRESMQSGDFARVTDLRYVDWALTTPLLLGSLVLYLSYTKKPMNFGQVAALLGLNECMLLFGYLGLANVPAEGATAGQVLSNYYWILGLMCFVGISALLLTGLEQDYVLWIFLAVWLLYGVVYFLEESMKQTLYNLLDVTSKAGFGIFLYFNWGA